ncbi:MAG: NAD(P)(+) transhydrogenase (Re/Si-specific) subunit beta, partial [Acidobacteria bacterium]|nr:NAD(P)(+) transhydrogenase (Re/Si-specific) subunit beta [Acidobacteriota bacterium]
MTELLYLAASVLFILGLKNLGSPRTARLGNQLAALGMLVAIVTVLVDLDRVSWGVIVSGMVVGAVIGAALALRVQMTSMPELVAAFNGFGGISSMLVALVALLVSGGRWESETGVTVVLSVVIGAITFTGSFIAYGKLKGIISGSPLLFRGGKTLNA